MNIALFCEGASEVNVITHIVEKYLGDDICVNALQPKVIDGKQNSFGGWYEVLSHCNNDDVEKAFATNDFLIIQIDSDTSHLVNYGAVTDEEKRFGLEDSVHYDKILTRLKINLSDEILEKYGKKIMFAICFNEIECWLLPLYYDNEKRCSTTNCVYTLNQAIGKDGFHIDDKQKNSTQAVAAYKKILKNLKAKNIPLIAQYNYGFNKFIRQLDQVKSDTSSS